MIVSLTIVRYRTRFIPVALLAMAVHRLPLWLAQKCTFWKLLGSGRNGTFDLQPDWRQWGLLAAWETREDYEAFARSSFVPRWWNAFTTEQWTLLAEPIASHGKWDGREPFKITGQSQVPPAPIAVLTRATIRLKKLPRFWQHVTPVANLMHSAPGYLTSVGIGEAPFFRQATFSLWENEDAVADFAYRSPVHREVIRKTREEGWYSEELFARFRPIASYGTLHGCDPLAGKLTNLAP
ncbi:DUF3291 domain-containing protein [Hufsiella ginkgonis]|uniref:DUF3291 domain-containing protein n=1 Tax=Hufsiella ginkgonis TaxID=2695274 RepID=A0A7K1XZN1_9SPHI|nr:DUF3291 domain-containing protein [Hufsiella ginkgonis]MXV16277.1 DUF3291 domain-containing protein [Hufsiella ginkgonis]